jgi:sRNA-binding carbon storage regulator CsrA
VELRGLRIGDDIKESVLNIGKNQIKLGVNDSGSVIINVQEIISKNR